MYRHDRIQFILQRKNKLISFCCSGLILIEWFDRGREKLAELLWMKGRRKNGRKKERKKKKKKRGESIRGNKLELSLLANVMKKSLISYSFCILCLMKWYRRLRKNWSRLSTLHLVRGMDTRFMTIGRYLKLRQNAVGRKLDYYKYR